VPTGLVDPKIAEHRGRIVKTTGDGMLVEFASVVDALRCAVEVQRRMAERNAEVPSDRRIDFRIGVNAGDIIIDGGDIIGDGVNIAARLEGLAKPGGVCISRKVRDEVRDKLDLVFEDMGEQEVKNIARPLRVFRIATPVIGQPTASTKLALALPDKPSVAVLPFQNMSVDPEQEYFADGIVEDMITALSRVHWLFVIARNSSFTYKGRAVDIKQVGRELGVRYVLEGSVRKDSCLMPRPGLTSGPIALTARWTTSLTSRTGLPRASLGPSSHGYSRRRSSARGESRPRIWMRTTTSCAGWPASISSRKTASWEPGNSSSARPNSMPTMPLLTGWRHGAFTSARRMAGCLIPSARSRKG
jgi:Adenylate and Guanylate cyclase catalytic domain